MWDCDYWSPDWCRSSRTFLMEETADDYTRWRQWQVNTPHQCFPLDSAEHFSDGKLGSVGEQELTEGEKEGVKSDLASCRNLRDEPLCYAADGHCKRSHVTVTFNRLHLAYLRKSAQIGQHQQHFFFRIEHGQIKTRDCIKHRITTCLSNTSLSAGTWAHKLAGKWLSAPLCCQIWNMDECF